MRRNVLLASLLLSAPAAAQWDPEPPVAMTYVCDGTYHTQVFVDGLQNDWEAEVQDSPRVMQLIEGEYQYDWTGPNDSSFMMWCRYTDNGLYFAVVGRDNAIVSPESGSDGDLFQVWLEFDNPTLDEDERVVMVEVPLWPLVTGDYTKPRWGYGEGRDGDLPSARAELAERTHGYFLEFNIPFIELREYRDPFGPIRFAAGHYDYDDDADYEEEVLVATSPVDRSDPDTFGTLQFNGVEAAIADIRESLSIDEGNQPFSPIYANFGGSASADLAFFIGDDIIVAGSGFSAFDWSASTIRFNDDHTPMELTTFDVDHDGDEELFYRYSRDRETLDGQRVVQEFIAAFDVRDSGIEQILLQEVAVELPGVGRTESELFFRDRNDRHMIRFLTPEDSTLAESDYVDIDEGVDVDYERMPKQWRGNRVQYDVDRNGNWYLRED